MDKILLKKASGERKPANFSAKEPLLEDHYQAASKICINHKIRQEAIPIISAILNSNGKSDLDFELSLLIGCMESENFPLFLSDPGGTGKCIANISSLIEDSMKIDTARNWSQRACASLFCHDKFSPEVLDAILSFPSKLDPYHLNHAFNLIKNMLEKDLINEKTLSYIGMASFAEKVPNRYPAMYAVYSLIGNRNADIGWFNEDSCHDLVDLSCAVNREAPSDFIPSRFSSFTWFLSSKGLSKENLGLAVSKVPSMEDREMISFFKGLSGLNNEPASVFKPF
ncbi:MAG: hypothetical protein NTY68_02015 [Candidatus Micrarchaeota archaeon]|nr:hypothetical protein [Candidatus Micrarchaeota archaeon]